MNTLKELITSTFNIYSLRRFLFLFFVCAVGITFISSSFISCAPGIEDPLSTNNDDDDDDDDRRDDDDDDDDDDEGEECKGNETCERVCEEIYEEFGEQRECMEKGDVKVAQMEKVHNLLVENFNDEHELKRNLEKISEEDGVDRDDFGDYLEVGGTKWEEAIKDGLPGKTKASSRDGKQNRLIVTLKWLIEDDDERAAKILSAEDAGDDILKALLSTLASYNPSDCLSKETTKAPGDRNTRTELWKVNKDPDRLEIFYFSDSTAAKGVIDFGNSTDRDLYNALSCHYEDNRGLLLGLGSGRNVFSYAVHNGEEDGNETLFGMAFELLDSICENVKRKDLDPKEACVRALMCYTAWKEDGEDPEDAGAIWEMAEERDSNLGGSTICRAERFAKFFVD